jgi:aryl-alcohol dehydrogenase-like predicted oxidoreductase
MEFYALGEILGLRMVKRKSFKWRRSKTTKQTTRINHISDCIWLYGLSISDWYKNLNFSPNYSLSLLAWCLKNDHVHCVLLGASSAEQLYENINSLHVGKNLLFSK